MEKQIRIGNLLYYLGRCVKVSGVILNTKENEGECVQLEGQEELGFFTLEDVRPIPLTERIIIDYGFVGTEMFDNLVFRIKDSFFLVAIDNKFYFPYLIDKDGIVKKSIQIKSVHHLQNLFFYTKGYEL